MIITEIVASIVLLSAFGFAVRISLYAAIREIMFYRSGVDKEDRPPLILQEIGLGMNHFGLKIMRNMMPSYDEEVRKQKLNRISWASIRIDQIFDKIPERWLFIGIGFFLASCISFIVLAGFAELYFNYQSML